MLNQLYRIKILSKGNSQDLLEIKNSRRDRVSSRDDQNNFHNRTKNLKLDRLAWEVGER